MIHTNITLSTALDPITVTIKGEEYLEVDNGRPILKPTFIETYDLSLQFIAEATHGRAYMARTTIPSSSAKYLSRMGCQIMRYCLLFRTLRGSCGLARSTV